MKRMVVTLFAVSLAALILGVGGTLAFIAYKASTSHDDMPAVTQTQTVEEGGDDKVKPPTRIELLKLVNEQRIKAGVKPMNIDSRLNWSAQRKADDEIKYHYFSHERNGVFIGQTLINSTKIPCVVVSENLHRARTSVSTSSEAVEGWISSPGHYAAMINPDYTMTGFGIASGNGVTQVVEHFCQPA